ncbi:MAG: hypothetical protein KJO00_02915 [Bacteroidia bacterium]|nr:hypothetical protein [Bacteroidia bacterium]NNK70997.1 hypothetical protein [Flavobacteriaceae bacterium]
MKTKQIRSILVFLLLYSPVQAQLMEKLKERAKEKGIETSNEVTYDSTAYDPNMKMDDDEDSEELVISSPEDFFNKDVVMTLYDANGQVTQTSYFDAQKIAMRTEMAGNPNPIYHDGEGKIYAYNDDKTRYESMKLLGSSAMGFMTAGMTTQIYNLPQEPYFNALRALEKIDSGLNFIILEMAFIYQPKHFEKNDFYIPSPINCGANTCLRFDYTNPEYAGSYIVFDSRGQLHEFNITSSKRIFEDNPAGRFVFKYKPCTVELPEAVEQSLIPDPLKKGIDLGDGLEPWKKKKKEKQKQKDN